MAETGEPVRLDDEKATASNIGDASQFAGLADPSSAVDAPPSRPEILFVLSSDESLEVDAPYDIAGLHEVQGRKRNGDCGRPSACRNAGLGSPNTVPTGVTIPQ